MISILCPSRGRPNGIGQLHASLMATTIGSWELIVRLDIDDPQYHRYPTFSRIRYLSGPRTVLSEYWNECYAHASGPYYMQCGDDIIFRTRGWDQQVIEAFPRDNIAFVHGDDGSVNASKIGTHGFLHRAWVETVGWFVPPYFSSDYNDAWLTEVADLISRRVYLPNVLTEHLHPAHGKGEWDITHQERLARHEADNVDALYYSDAMRQERVAWAEKLRSAIDG